MLIKRFHDVFYLWSDKHYWWYLDSKPVVPMYYGILFSELYYKTTANHFSVAIWSSLLKVWFHEYKHKAAEIKTPYVDVHYYDSIQILLWLIINCCFITLNLFSVQTVLSVIEMAVSAVSCVSRWVIHSQRSPVSQLVLNLVIVSFIQVWGLQWF